jgi:hypothetical protein
MPATQGGWVSWGSWTNQTGSRITTFVTSWEVPPAPAVAGGQLIYLFNGLEDTDQKHILQPVLQWGVSPAKGSGNAWGLASFWVGQDTDPMFCSEWVAVQPGTVVTGRMTVEAEADGLFSCTCSFDGYPGTELTAEELPALVNCSLALEAYNTGPNAPYPAIAGSDFVRTNVDAANGVPNLNWASNGNAVVVQDGGANADVRVVYPQAGA